MNKILIIVAHPDDETLGCGGTILKLKKLNCEVEILFMTNGVSSRDKSNENDILQRKKYTEKAMDLYKIKNFRFADFPDNQMDKITFIEIVKKIEDHVFSLKPDIIFTHYANDLNIDHKLTYEATNTCIRSFKCDFISEVFSFEIPSSTEQNFNNKFSPNVYFDISRYIDKKIDIFNSYESEVEEMPHPRSSIYIRALSQFRGGESNFNNAEAFKLLFKRNK